MGASAEAVTRILVKMPNWVGDCVMATPALGLIKAALPDVTIDLMCRPSVAGIMQDNPHKTNLIEAREKDLPAELRAQIRGARYDAVALMTNSLGSAWMAFRLGIPRRVGFNREGRGLLLTHRLAFNPLEWRSPTPRPLSRRSIKGVPQPGLPCHMVEYYLRIASATIEAIAPGRMKTMPPADYKMTLPLNRDAERKVAALLREAGIMGKTLIGINPGAAHGPAKRWPAERLGHVVDGLDRPDWAFVSTAAPGESQLNDVVQKETPVKIHRLGEKTTLRELPALISRLAVLVTNDSGPMHIAAARQVPTVAIFGPTDQPNTRPWDAPAALMRHPVPCSPCFLEECPIDHRCMAGVEAFEVAEQVMMMLNQANKWKPLAS